MKFLFYLFLVPLSDDHLGPCSWWNWVDKGLGWLLLEFEEEPNWTGLSLQKLVQKLEQKLGV